MSLRCVRRDCKFENALGAIMYTVYMSVEHPTRRGRKGFRVSLVLEQQASSFLDLKNELFSKSCSQQYQIIREKMGNHWSVRPESITRRLTFQTYAWLVWVVLVEDATIQYTQNASSDDQCMEKPIQDMTIPYNSIVCVSRLPHKERTIKTIYIQIFQIYTLYKQGFIPFSRPMMDPPDPMVCHVSSRKRSNKRFWGRSCWRHGLILSCSPTQETPSVSGEWL